MLDLRIYLRGKVYSNNYFSYVSFGDCGDNNFWVWYLCGTMVSCYSQTDRLYAQPWDRQ